MKERINIKIGEKIKPFIIAEMSGNHNQSIERALHIVEAAAKCKVDALKLQTFSLDLMTLDSNAEGFIINDSNSLWKGKKLYDLYKEAYTPWEWHKPIFDKCKELGIIGFSTPFDEPAVNFLESLNVPCYKIASFEIVDIPLIKKIASTGKPIIMSTGMATIEEIQEAIDACKNEGNDKIVLLKCTSSYPAIPSSSNLLTIPDMMARFNCSVGISDHTLGLGVSVASVALGATVIEKHFTLSRVDGGIDSAFSMEPQEMHDLVIESERAWQALGTVNYIPTAEEKKTMRFRRSLYVVNDMKAGDLFTLDNLKSIRPAGGISPKHINDLLGKKISKNTKKGTPITWDLVIE